MYLVHIVLCTSYHGTTYYVLCIVCMRASCVALALSRIKQFLLREGEGGCDPSTHRLSLFIYIYIYIIYIQVHGYMTRTTRTHAHETHACVHVCVRTRYLVHITVYILYVHTLLYIVHRTCVCTHVRTYNMHIVHPTISIPVHLTHCRRCSDRIAALITLAERASTSPCSRRKRVAPTTAPGGRDEHQQCHTSAARDAASAGTAATSSCVPSDDDDDASRTPVAKATPDAGATENITTPATAAAHGPGRHSAPQSADGGGIS